LLTTTFCALIVLVAVFSLAKRNNQDVKKVSLSLRHGFTAEFLGSKRRKT
jgi:hypothetical protein